MILYHTTGAEMAEAILRDGFRDGTGRYMTDREWSGVCLSDEPFGELEYCEALLRVDLNLSEHGLADYEWIEEGKGYREWLVPAAILNPAITEIRFLDFWEELVRRCE